MGKRKRLNRVVVRMGLSSPRKDIAQIETIQSLSAAYGGELVADMMRELSEEKGGVDNAKT